MDENLKYIIALILGTLISPLWTRFLGRKKTGLEEANLRSDECIKTLALFEKSIEQLKEEINHSNEINKQLQAKISDLEAYNKKQDDSYLLRLNDVKTVNYEQSKKILELEQKVKECADHRQNPPKPAPKKPNNKKRPPKK